MLYQERTDAERGSAPRPEIILSLGSHADQGLQDLPALTEILEQTLSNHAGRVIWLTEDASCPANITAALLDAQLEGTIGVPEAYGRLRSFYRDRRTRMPQEYLDIVGMINGTSRDFVRAEEAAVVDLAERFPGRVLVAFEATPDSDLDRRLQQETVIWHRQLESVVNAFTGGDFTAALGQFRAAKRYEAGLLRRRDEAVATQIGNLATIPDTRVVFARFGSLHRGIAARLTEQGFSPVIREGWRPFAPGIQSPYEKLMLALSDGREADVTDLAWMQAMLYSFLRDTFAVLRSPEPEVAALAYVWSAVPSVAAAKQFEVAVRTHGFLQAVFLFPPGADDDIG